MPWKPSDCLWVRCSGTNASATTTSLEPSALQAHGVPGVFDHVVAARYQEGAVAAIGQQASQQGPAAVVATAAPAPAAGEAEPPVDRLLPCPSVRRRRTPGYGCHCPRHLPGPWHPSGRSGKRVPRRYLPAQAVDIQASAMLNCITEKLLGVHFIAAPARGLPGPGKSRPAAVLQHWRWAAYVPRVPARALRRNSGCSARMRSSMAVLSWDCSMAWVSAGEFMCMLRRGVSDLSMRRAAKVAYRIWGTPGGNRRFGHRLSRFRPEFQRWEGRPGARLNCPGDASV